MEKLKVFDNPKFGEIRTMEIDGEPWFVGKDIAECLGYSNYRDALKKHTDDEDKGVAKCDTLGGIQNLVIINESGLYSLILSSKLPTAKRFKRWVTNEVLPAIRKHGAYAVEEVLNNPDMLISALTALKQERAEKQRLEAENAAQTKQIADMQPKVDFYDSVADSKTAIPIGNVAKVLGIRGIGRNKLFAILRNRKVLMRDNIPYQCYIDRGYFRVVECKYTDVYGELKVSFKTLVYQRGVDFIRKMLME